MEETTSLSNTGYIVEKESLDPTQEFFDPPQESLDPPQESHPKLPLQAQDIFNYFDHDGNGKLDVREFKNLVFEMGERMSVEEVKKILEVLGCDRDGMLHFGEFHTWWQSETKPQKTILEERISILRMKLRSENYMKQVIRNRAGGDRSTPRPGNDKYRADFCIELGTVNTTTASVALHYQESILEAISLKKKCDLNELVVGSISFICKQDTPQECLDHLCALVSNLSSLITERDDIPISSIVAKIQDEDGKKIFRISASVDTAVAMIAQGVLQALAISELSFSLVDDTSLGNSNSNSKICFSAEFSNASVDLLGELFGGKLPRHILYTLSWFQNVAVHLRFLSFEEALKYPGLERIMESLKAKELLKLMKHTVLPGTLLSKCIELFLMWLSNSQPQEVLDMVRPVYETIYLYFELLDRFSVILGDTLFELEFNVPFLFKCLPSWQELVEKKASMDNQPPTESRQIFKI